MSRKCSAFAPASRDSAVAATRDSSGKMRQRCRNLTGGPGVLKTLCVRSGKSRQQCRCLSGGIREDATALSPLNGGPRGVENAMRSLRGAGKRCLLQRKGERKLDCLSSAHILFFFHNSDWGGTQVLSRNDAGEKTLENNTQIM